MTAYQELQAHLASHPQRWLVTGGAGFIGSHVVEKLLMLDQRVTVLDDLSTGNRPNLDAARSAADDGGTMRMAHFVQGDIRDEATCRHVMEGIDRVIHLGAMGSVPISMEKPDECHAINVTGTLNVFLAAQKAGVKQVAYASSSAVYGDDALETKHEESIGKCLSPYAASKRMNEIYAQTLHTSFGQRLVGLRFFNVFGPRQDPRGPYAAAVPIFIEKALRGDAITIYGDGGQTRDFIYVKDIVAAIVHVTLTRGLTGVYNAGYGKMMTVNELAQKVIALAGSASRIDYLPERAGDVRHSRAAIDALLSTGFQHISSMEAGLQATLDYFRRL